MRRRPGGARGIRLEMRMHKRRAWSHRGFQIDDGVDRIDVDDHVVEPLPWRAQV